MSDTRDWTAREDGEIFCAPACGAGCTKKEYEEVVKAADKLVAECKEQIGGEWEPRVHENLGWHYSAQNPKAGIEIRYGGYGGNQDNKYRVGFLGGTPVQVSTHPERFDNPLAAYKAQLALIKAEAYKWTGIEAMMKAQLHIELQ